MDRPARPSTSCISVREWTEKCAAFGNRCAYCGSNSAKLVIEHVESRMRGGLDRLDNIVPACPSCNNSKGDLLLLEWTMVRAFLWKRTGRGCRYTNVRLREEFT